MNNKLNFKIVGSGPTGLLLSIALSKFDCNIFLTDLLTKDKLIDKDKTYAITHSTKKILTFPNNHLHLLIHVLTKSFCFR